MPGANKPSPPTGIVPVAVFAGNGPDPELHVDARYLAPRRATRMARRRAFVAVRNEHGLMGIVDGRDLPAGHRRDP